MKPYASDAWWVTMRHGVRDLATWVHVCKPCRSNEHGKCTGDCDCAKNGHPKNPGGL